jgi:hypothetical protein
MHPRGRARLCASCDRLVHDLTALTEREARALLRSPPAEGLCVRYLHDAYGNIWFAGDRPAPVIPVAQLLRGRAARAAAASVLALAPLLTEACGGANPNVDYDGSPGLHAATPAVGAAEDRDSGIDGAEPDGNPCCPEAGTATSDGEAGTSPEASDAATE